MAQKLAITSEIEQIRETSEANSSRSRVAGRLPLVVTVLALLAMLSDALELDWPTTPVRNASVAFIAVGLVLASFRGARLGGGNGVPLALTLLAGWVSLRVFYDDGVQIIPLLLAGWLPFTFFAAYTSRASGAWIERLFWTFTVIAAALYVWTTASTGLHGALLINAVYYPVLGLPFVLARSGSWQRVVGVLAILIATGASNKRTALLATLVAVLLYVIFTRAERAPQTSRPARPALIAGSFVIGSATSYWIALKYLNTDILARFANLDEDGGSGRGEIYSWVWDRIDAASLQQILAGRGANAVARDNAGTSAHNDFLEIAYDYGMIGLLLYLSLYVCIFSTLFHLARTRSKFTGPWAASIGIFITLSMLSHLVFIPTYVALLGVFWGYVLRDTANESTVADAPLASVSMSDSPEKNRTARMRNAFH